VATVTVASLTGLAAVTAGPAHTAGAAAAARAADPGTALVRETFTGATAPEFTGYNEACLTGAPAGRPSAGDHVLGGCEATEVGPVPPLDAAPYGYAKKQQAPRATPPGPFIDGVEAGYIGVGLDVLVPAGSPGDHTTCHGTYVTTHAASMNGLVINTAVAAG